MGILYETVFFLNYEYFFHILFLCFVGAMDLAFFTSSKLNALYILTLNSFSLVLIQLFNAITKRKPSVTIRNSLCETHKGNTLIFRFLSVFLLVTQFYLLATVPEGTKEGQLF